MVAGKVPNSELVEAGLALMAEAGKPLERAESKGRSMIYRTDQGETVRVRTCNDHVLVVLADRPTLDASLNIEGTDHLLVVMPEVPRTPGNIVAYFVPTAVAVAAARSSHSEWLATNPNTKGENRTWNIWFDDKGLSKANGFGVKWSEFRLNPAANARPKHTPMSQAAASSANLGQVIAESKQMIATAAGVPVSAVKITIDLA